MLLVAALFAMTAYAQKIKVTGTVTDGQNKEPLTGVTVKEKGAGNGAITDINGNYTISVPADATLQFTCMGFVMREIPVNHRARILEDARRACRHRIRRAAQERCDRIDIVNTGKGHQQPACVFHLAGSSGQSGGREHHTEHRCAGKQHHYKDTRNRNGERRRPAVCGRRIHC